MQLAALEQAGAEVRALGDLARASEAIEKEALDAAHEEEKLLHEQR